MKSCLVEVVFAREKKMTGCVWSKNPWGHLELRGIGWVGLREDRIVSKMWMTVRSC
jgi:hypothetical protein